MSLLAPPRITFRWRGGGRGGIDKKKKVTSSVQVARGCRIFGVIFGCSTKFEKIKTPINPIVERILLPWKTAHRSKKISFLSFSFPEKGKKERKRGGGGGARARGWKRGGGRGVGWWLGSIQPRSENAPNFPSSRVGDMKNV